METVIAVLFSFWTFFFLSIWILWLAHIESEGWGLFWIIPLAILLFIEFSFNIEYILLSLIIYIPIGIVWSLIRWKKYCKKRIADHKAYAERTDSNLNLEEYISDWLQPSNNITKIINWIFGWPFSIINNVLGDIIDFVTDFVKTKIIFLYNNITNDLLADEPPENK